MKENTVFEFGSGTLALPARGTIRIGSGKATIRDGRLVLECADNHYVRSGASSMTTPHTRSALRIAPRVAEIIEASGRELTSEQVAALYVERFDNLRLSSVKTYVRQLTGTAHCASRYWDSKRRRWRNPGPR